MSASAHHLEAQRIAERVAQKACELLAGADQSNFAIRTKTNAKDLVTEWDTKVEELILEELAIAAPGVAVLAEESGEHGSGSERWLVDPIDGTVNFAHGMPFYAISICLEENHEPVAGVTHAPAMNWIFSAAKGAGATHNGQLMRVSKVNKLSQALVASGFPYDRAETRHNFPQWEHFLAASGGARRIGAATLDLAFVARGWLDGYWETRLHPWDIAAGALFVREAGGQVTGITGEPFRAQSGHSIASNGAIHREILDELAVVGTPAI